MFLRPGKKSMVKSVQRGTAAGPGTVTISPVDPTKTEVNSYSRGSAGAAASASAVAGISKTGGGTPAQGGEGGRVNSTVSWPTWSGTLTGGTTDLTVKEYGAVLTNSNTLTVSGACEWEVFEYA